MTCSCDFAARIRLIVSVCSMVPPMLFTTVQPKVFFAWSHIAHTHPESVYSYLSYNVWHASTVRASPRRSLSLAWQLSCARYLCSCEPVSRCGYAVVAIRHTLCLFFRTCIAFDLLSEYCLMRPSHTHSQPAPGLSHFVHNNVVVRVCIYLMAERKLVMCTHGRAWCSNGKRNAVASDRAPAKWFGSCCISQKCTRIKAFRVVEKRRIYCPSFVHESWVGRIHVFID